MFVCVCVCVCGGGGGLDLSGPKRFSESPLRHISITGNFNCPYSILLMIHI